ncbi:MAG TPA: SDR family oxidoreductase [Nitrospiraceae bacterium]|nr:SDR family oxidoreductase [Nitrospiraceae bacterium]
MSIASSNSARTVVVTGAGGLIGSYLVGSAFRWVPGWRVVGLTRHELDLMDRSAVRDLWQRLKPEAIVHCAAISKAVACQDHPELARRVNVEATGHLADLASGSGARLLFLSTDHVFDGRQGSYTETDPVSPLTLYGETKVAAERLVLAHERHLVLRTSLNAGLSPTGDRSFVEELILAWRVRRPLTLFTDEYRCPIPAAVTARAIWELIRTAPSGLYHLAGQERLSRWDLGQLIASLYPELEPSLRPGTLRDYAGPPRSPDLSLNCDKVGRHLSFQLPGFRGWLQRQRGNPVKDLWRPDNEVI